MATEIHSYRVGDDVHRALRRLAGIHGSVDKALRHFLTAGGAFEPEVQIETRNVSFGNGEEVKIDLVVPAKSKSTTSVRPFKGAILKPKERER
jgi:hypothetical protein